MLSSRSVNCSSDTLRASLTLRRSPLPPTPHPQLLTGIYLHIRTRPCYLSTQATAPSALPYQPDPAPLTFPSSHCPPLVPSKSNTRQQCAEARRRGRCWAVVQRRRPGPRRRCGHRGAVIGGQAAPDTATRARSGRPAGGRRSRGCPDTGHAGRHPVGVLCPPCGCPSNRSSGRPVSTRPVSTRPVPSRCPDGRASGVRGAAAALSAPRWPLEWLGAAGRPRGAQWVRRCRRGPRAAWSPARMGAWGEGMVLGWPWVAGTRVA
jgi:hypothetical protein